ncbi:MAG TPA: ATP-dependent Clp protease ATP-binding subunit, partial [Cyclobacteriaceae bacterium]|nr:ATP-dependent Clp protease ATP-binding subunit [Cyclobacteriaceae bacterium]
MTALTQDLSLSDELKKTVKIAQAIAKEYMHPEFGPAHLLKALLHEDAGLLPLLESLDQDIFYLEEWAEVRSENLLKSVAYSEVIPGDAAIAEVIHEAENIRLKLAKDTLMPVHVLAAISTPGVAFSYEQMKSFPLHREDLINHITANEEIQAVLASPNSMASESPVAKPTHALLKYCRDKTQLGREGKLDNIVGRENELRMMAEILCRRSKPNVMLVGEPGVGKSALAEGFALAIVNQKVSKQLHDARVFELDSGSLVAGASYKGEVEERLKNILAEIKKFDKAILFIDEIHSLLDKQGAAAGSANLLKPELARGEITVIGATTLDEYRKYLEPDEAFSRRFELLLVEEPSAQTCYHMLKAVVPYYEQHHGLSVPDETVHEAIKLAKRYLKDRRLPDAAIDLADRSMAALRLINDNGTKSIQEAKNKFDQWCENEEEIHSLEEWKWFYRQLRQELSPILWGSIASEEDPDKMAQVEDVRKYLQNALEVLEQAASRSHTTLGKAELAAIVSHKTGIPIGKVQTREKERLLNMEAGLKQRVVGQDHAIRSIADAILESRAGLSKPGQPLGSFFFLGPTGTGKTELAKSLAEFLFQDESFM